MVVTVVASRIKRPKCICVCVCVCVCPTLMLSYLCYSTSFCFIDFTVLFNFFLFLAFTSSVFHFLFCLEAEAAAGTAGNVAAFSLSFSSVHLAGSAVDFCLTVA